MKKTDFDKFFSHLDSKIKKDKTSIYSFDPQLKIVKYVQKNSKIAGIFDHLNISKKNIEWLDTKFDENYVDCIVTYPIQMSKNKNQKEIEKIYNEMFYQFKYILKKKGTIVLLAQKYELIETYAEKHKFNIIKKRLVYSGKQPLFILTIKKD